MAFLNILLVERISWLQKSSLNASTTNVPTAALPIALSWALGHGAETKKSLRARGA